MRVLVLEDDHRLCEALARRLRADGATVDAVGTLQEARRALEDNDYDCAVLDRLVPDGDALDLVLEVGDRADGPPILMISGIDDPEERVLALKAGADDYVVKPVRLDEVAVRVTKLRVRRTSTTREPVKLGAVVVDRLCRRVAIGGVEVHLTRSQYSVLDYLIVNRHRVVPMQELVDHCCDPNKAYRGNPLHSHITRIRKVLGDALRLVIVHNAGYRLEAGDDPPADG